MKKERTSLLRVYFCLLSGLLLFGTPQIALSSIVNGGFESGDLSGWTSSGNVSVFDNSFGCCDPSEGAYFANFNGFNKDATGEISQTFATISGDEYQLTFNFGKGGTSGGTASLVIDVLGINTLLSTPVNDSSGGAPGAYDSFSFNFIADSISTTLSFRDASTGVISSFDALLDNVSVSAVPIPAAVWLFGTAIFGLFGFSKRRKSAWFK